MGKKLNINLMSLVIAVAIVLVAALVLFNSLRRTTHVTLPDDTPETEQGAQTGEDTINAVTVSTDTVQAIIGSLARSDYRRTIRIEQFWSGGSGTREVTVTLWEGKQRLDEILADGRVEHSIAAGETLYLWYGDAHKVHTTPLGDFTLDQMQGIPTYEDVLALEQDDIVQAYYESLSGVRCIYVETCADDDGYAGRYWVSVDNGLLVAAERLEEDETIYRMAVVAEEPLTEAQQYFILPDDTAL